MNIITPIPQNIYLACSGGIDSMFGYHFLTQGRKNVKCLFFHHGTKTSDEAEIFLKENIKNLEIGRLSREKEKGESPEKFFRDERYKFFGNFIDNPIITCHHLNDCVENWIATSLRGEPRLIPYKNGNIIRPFLMVSKKEIVNYCSRKNVMWIEDKTNFDVTIPRNRIRHNVIKELVQVNPGFFRMVKEKINDLSKIG